MAGSCEDHSPAREAALQEDGTGIPAQHSPARIVEKKRSQKRQRMGAATTWFTAPEWIFLSSLAGR